MLFNSLHFLLFFPVVTGTFFLLPHRFRWALLLIASCYFYMVFRPIYILILAFTIAVDYAAGLLIARSQGRRRKLMLVMSILANTGVLMFFKYYNFANHTFGSISTALGFQYPIPALNILLPIGLSFHVFQSLSYTIEVYRSHQEPERHLGIFALYVMFYPQLVAGPIERPQNLLHQFHEEHAFDCYRVVRGLQLMLLGFFKKVVIADRLAPFVNQVYDHPTQFPGISLIIATVCFAIQIYCDFSGYSDIALGSAQVMGFKLMRNFNRPYFSKSIAEFWKRWHISLSTWFRDYVYISLGGNRGRTYLVCLNLLITFAVSGLWHGANWTFVIWGALNGCYLIVEVLAARAFPKPKGGSSSGFLHRSWQVVRVFALTCFAWIFFRANNTSDAIYVASHLFSGATTLLRDVTQIAFLKRNVLLMQSKNDAMLAVAAILILLGFEMLERSGDVRDRVSQWPPALRWAVYYAATGAVIFFGAYNTSQQFIYFQF